ncbi:MAG: hypothetical protein FD123_3916 [Bacteroidetes bacterium]|nr:MAG: hypothetical protein FD123_3916 [Bacteroidota bacterium]
MSANKKLTGTVIRDTVFKGSKSEHAAFLLKTATDSYILRKPGENPFMGKFFETWLGKKVTASGSLDGKTFFVDEIAEDKSDT